MHACKYAGMHVRLERENRYTDFYEIWHDYLLRPGRDFRKVETPEKCQVRVPVREVPVARNLSTIEERHETRFVCFNEEITAQRP
jgi:hypothetical protein